MVVNKQSWLKYAVRDEDGFVKGIKKSAPDEEKEAYKKWRRAEAKSRVVINKSVDKNGAEEYNRDSFPNHAGRPGKRGGSLPREGGHASVNGPSETKSYIKEYFEQHPEVRKNVEKYRSVLKKVKNFYEDHPNPEDGSYSVTTGERLDIDNGYCVTFHQNYQIGNEYGQYDDETYAEMCAIAQNELNSEDVYIGYFGNPEVSFHCPDSETAKRFAVKHNQHSVYNAEIGKTWVNDKYDYDTNPIQGKEKKKK